MHTFRVWATIPKQVELALGPWSNHDQSGRPSGAGYSTGRGKKRLPMKRDNDKAGSWTLEVPSAKAGEDYGFVLDGEGPFPDPRSPWQPNGVHALSRLVDHAAFSWTDSGFNPDTSGLTEAVVYELHVGTFTPEGTFASAITKLDQLAQLGVTHVELMPVNEFSGNHGWGYDGVDLFAPHHAYGRPEDLKQLVNACHARGMAVLLDVVYNHLGPSGNYLGRFAPYFTDRYHTPWGAALNFDGAHSDEVRRFFCDNALMWLRDYHFDGLRLDAVHAICDQSAWPFLEQLGDEVKALARQAGRRLVVIAESDLNDPRLIWPKEHGGFALEAQWGDDFHHSLHAALTGERRGYYEDFGTLADLAKALRHAYVYDGRYSVYRRRRHGRPTAGLDGRHFFGYAQNHDQVGNRAGGERLSQLVSAGRLKIAAALVFSSPFVPMLFQGEEWAAGTPFQYFTDHPEPDLAKAVREGRRREFAGFGWKPEDVPDPQARETFMRSKLNWTEPAREPHAALLDWHRRLIQLRRTEPALRDDRLDSVNARFDESARWFALERGPVTVVFNLANSPQRIPLPEGRHDVLLASEPGIGTADNEISLPPDAVAILKSDRLAKGISKA